MSDVVLLALIAVVPSVLTGIVTYLLGISRQPRENATSDINWQQESIAAWAAQNALTTLLSETNTKLALALAESAALGRQQANAIGLLTETNTAQLVKIDGLPKMISEQIAQKLKDDAYILELQDALYKVGLSRHEQPQQTPAKPLTPLTHEGAQLMQDAADVKSAPADATALHVGDIIKLEAPPDTPKE